MIFYIEVNFKTGLTVLSSDWTMFMPRTSLRSMNGVDRIETTGKVIRMNALSDKPRDNARGPTGNSSRDSLQTVAH